MSIVCIMTVVLVGGWFGRAQIVLAGIMLFSCVGMLLFFGGRFFKVSGISERKSLAFFTPGVILLTGIFLYGLISFYGLEIYNWDEMHQWAKSVNYMLANNALPMGEEFDGESVLLSATTLFHYYFCKLPLFITRELAESNKYVSNLVLWFAAVILPLSGQGWKNWKKCFCYGITLFLAMNVLFVQPYYNIYCDQPVTMWAGALIAWVIFCEKKKYSAIFIVLSILNISYMKSMMGPLFAVIFVMVMGIHYVLSFPGGVRPVIRAVKKDIDWKKVLYAAGCVVSIFLVTALWSVRIQENALVRTESVKADGEDRLVLTLTSGVSKWFQEVNLDTTFPSVSFFLFFVLVVVIGYFVVKRYLVEKERTEYGTLIILYGFGFLAFFALMMYSYMTTFTYADSIVTGSLNRYLSDYILLGYIPVVIPVYLMGRKENADVFAAVLLIFFALGTTNNFASRAIGQVLKQDANYEERVNFADYQERAASLMDTDEKIYMINQNSDGYFTVAADYVFGLQLDRAGMCYYFSDMEQEIVGLSQVNIRVLPRILLNGYGYLWIYKSDDYFDNRAFSVLKIKEPVEGDFYKVVNQDGHLQLKYLGNIQGTQEEEE